MAGRVAGKVAFITGAARGQGRSHAIRLAQEGADIIAVDLCGQIGSVPYAMATPDDLAETVKEVEALDRRIVATQADVRDYPALKAALDDGVAQLGHLDIVSANAGIFSFGTLEELDETHWQDMIDVNLTGVWHAAKAAIPHLRAAGGGSIILVGSVSALAGFTRAQDAYTAAKGALISLNKSLAIQFAKDNIRCNVIHPGIVETPLQAPYLNDALRAEFKTGIPLGRIGQPRDIANAALFLASDESSFMTGAEMIVDGGFMAQ
jgi:SDR family mycofactocin-dependent oxidoreductase